MRFVGAACCLPLLLAGGIILWYSIDGLLYAVTNSPAVDRPGDLFSVGLATLIGLLLVFFASRWLFIIVRLGKRKRSRPGV